MTHSGDRDFLIALAVPFVVAATALAIFHPDRAPIDLGPRVSDALRPLPIERYVSHAPDMAAGPSNDPHADYVHERVDFADRTLRLSESGYPDRVRLDSGDDTAGTESDGPSGGNDYYGDDGWDPDSFDWSEWRSRWYSRRYNPVRFPAMMFLGPPMENSAAGSSAVGDGAVARFVAPGQASYSTTGVHSNGNDGVRTITNDRVTLAIDPHALCLMTIRRAPSTSSAALAFSRAITTPDGAQSCVISDVSISDRGVSSLQLDWTGTGWTQHARVTLTPDADAPEAIVTLDRRDERGLRTSYVANLGESRARVDTIGGSLELAPFGITRTADEARP